MASLKYREEGNKWFKSAFDAGLSPSLQAFRLEKAMKSYNTAYERQRNNNQKASAAKNIAICEWKLGALSWNEVSKGIPLNHFKRAFSFFGVAMRSGTSVKSKRYNEVSAKSKEWSDELVNKYTSCFYDLHDRLEDLGLKERIQYLVQIVPSIDLDDLLADIYLELAQHHFHIGINALQTRDYHTCKYHMDECHFPIYEAQRYGSSREDIVTEVNVLLEDTRMHRCMAESAQALNTGDKLLKKITTEHETLNIDMVWEVIDWYKQSILVTREMDMEREAIALSRIGSVYFKVLKMRVQAKEYYRESVVFAESMHPRTFNNCDWYKESTATLRRFQEETVMFEEEKRQKKQEKAKSELGDEFKELRSNDYIMENREFLQYVYKTYPPKNPEFTLDMGKNPDYATVKKLLQKAIIHYHPDRVDSKIHGLRWKVLSEEVTKYLTSRYERMKM